MATPEERAATKAMEDAINQYREAYCKAHPEAVQNGTLIDWVVVAAEVKPDPEDPTDDVTAYTIMMAGGGIAWYRAVGLLQAGQHYFTHNSSPQEDS